ncbi:FCS-Like Zinc finger 15-like isoform X2 [Tripterygium wilfordii]|uniref:FCS-Like Zinc finger 15-like isoform X2 n=1 Tax=Tripterygium wilfordii TaxID=458696 RepID=UPI0018F846CD|nr:FCS-Like Zinc finger 15-like isoform X2 [Tripterygium wilfordii]
MVGLSIVLEAQKGVINHNNKKIPQVINKTTMIINNKNKPSSSSSSSSTSKRLSQSSSFPVPTFLEHCFLCRQKLLPGKDIYIGDRAFCSVECRCRQIFMDEEESLSKKNCSLAAMKPTSASASAAAAASPSGSRHGNKGARNRPGGFAC